MIERPTRTSEERGSALLVSLMVMVGLSLLGLGFVTASETESAISANQRNYTQALSIAETGVKAAVEWFQNPESMADIGLLPVNHVNLKTTRILGGTGIGYYKGSGGDLFDRPFKPAPVDRLYGDVDHADVKIDRNSVQGRAFLDAFNTAILGNTQNGEVTEILVYAPPIVGGTLNGDGFWEGGTRYGLATIRATSTIFRDRVARTGIIAERSVTVVVTEWPFPGPQGPVQSNASISTAGNFGVHWGKMTSSESMNIFNSWAALPWFNAYDRITIDRGYPTQNKCGPFDDQPCEAQYLPLASGTDLPTDHDWLAEMVGRTVVDPWWEARSRMNITNMGGDTTPIPYAKIDHLVNDVVSTPRAGYSGWGQFQDRNDYPNHKEVIFPRIDYDFWKEIAIQGSSSGQEGIYYLRPTGGINYTDGSTTKNFGEWVNVNRDGNPGFYFFDTMNGLNPQGPGAPGTLAPAILLNSGVDGPGFRMEGFIYLNVASYQSTGLSPPTQWVPFPGEPYRDVGYQRINPGTGEPIAGQANFDANNGQWDYQDVNDNGRFDVFVNNLVAKTRPSGGGSFFPYLPVAHYVGCNPGVNCSEPHEPYLNIIYPTTAKTGGMGGSPTPVVVGWQPQGAQTRRAKARPGGVTPACPSDNTFNANCTSNGYDRDGGYTNDLQLLLNGVLYVEGDFLGTAGNGEYFGSVLVEGDFSSTGTSEVWFDERLIKGDWPPPEFNFPRVYISAMKTDE